MQGSACDSRMVNKNKQCKEWQKDLQMFLGKVIRASACGVKHDHSHLANRARPRTILTCRGRQGGKMARMRVLDDDGGFPGGGRWPDEKVMLRMY